MTRLPQGQPGHSYAGQGVFARVRKRMEVGLIESIRMKYGGVLVL